MDLRSGLAQIAAEHRLDAAATRRLEAIAGLDDEPASLAKWLPRGVAVLAAALGGLGVVFWIASLHDKPDFRPREAELAGSDAREPELT